MNIKYTPYVKGATKSFITDNSIVIFIVQESKVRSIDMKMNDSHHNNHMNVG
ncbi:MAG TPA: hypothetical protein VJP58_01400 [Candidatus Nitrosocosmicus sp.]|nr:hypothetical protein [Candidatus Nitrosocosmicus sp.]